MTEVTDGAIPTDWPHHLLEETRIHHFPGLEHLPGGMSNGDDRQLVATTARAAARSFRS